jgi:hypothetical protein
MKGSTSAGLPYLRRKSEVIIDPNDNLDWPCVLFTRTQEEGKTRDVWGYPMGKLALEGRYFLPYFEMFRRHPIFAAYGGPDEVDEGVSKILFAKERDDVVYSEDFSSYDNSIPPELSTTVFNYIRSAFQKHVEHSDNIARISDNFVNIGISTPDGVYTGPHGIPSGSWFTSVVGSFVHAIAANAVREIHSSRNQIMGDDGVIALPPSFDKKYIADVYDEFNLTLNEDKTFESRDEVIFLQRYYSSDYKQHGLYRGIYPVYRALNRLIHMERWTNIEEMSGADYFAIRAISILENCKWHPMFEAFVKWVHGKDKYNLEYTSQGLHEYIRRFATKTITSIKHQYSEDVQGIGQFETVKILKTL